MGKIYQLFLTLALMTFSCTKRLDGPVIIETGVDILLIDEASNNVLASGHFNVEDLKIYYLINGKKQLFFNAHLDYPKGYAVVKNQDNQSILRVFLNTDTSTPVTLIEYPEGDTDTIKSDFNRQGSSIICTKVWYNDVLKWDVGNSQFPETRTFVIIKKF